MFIEEQLVKGTGRTWPGVSACTSITVHETANTRAGAGARAHANLQSRGNVRQASWHLQVDDREVIRSYPDEARCWHAGWDARDSIAIEICVNRDGDYDQALRNAAKLVAALRYKHGLGREAVKQHYDWTGKGCPSQLRSSGRWDEFVASTDPVKEPEEETVAVDSEKLNEMLEQGARLERLLQALVEASIADMRREAGLPPEPESDQFWGDRIGDGRRVRADAWPKLLEKKERLG